MKLNPNPLHWHQYATRAGFTAGVADDHLHAATERHAENLRAVVRSLDSADAALCSALRDCRHARKHAGDLLDEIGES